MRIEPDHDLLGVGVHERFAIPQRALLVPSADAGNVLWDCISVVTADAVDRLNDAGGVDMIAISHPHFYASMVEWSDAFGGVPILVHAADEEWISRRSPAVRTWDGDRLVLSPTVNLLHLPGHFPGSAALHWTAAPGGRAVLLAGDSMHVAGDRRHVTVMHSVPNYIPVGAVDDRRPAAPSRRDRVRRPLRLHLGPEHRRRRRPGRRRLARPLPAGDRRLIGTIANPTPARIRTTP